MVLQVFPHPRKIMHNGHAARLQQGRRSHAGHLQELGRADGPGGKHHFGASFDALRVPIFRCNHHPFGSTIPQHQFGHMGPGDNLQIGPFGDGMQKGFGAIPANATTLIDLKIITARIIALVEVPYGRYAGLRRRATKIIQQLPG